MNILDKRTWIDPKNTVFELQHNKTHPDLHDLLASEGGLDPEMCGVVSCLPVLIPTTDPNFLITCLLLSFETLNWIFPVENDLTLNKELV